MRARSLLLFSMVIAACEQPGDAPRTQQEEAYDRYRRPDLLIAALKLKGDERVLDVGAGTGYLALPIARVVKQVVAIDIDEDALETLRARDGSIETRVVPPDDPKLSDERYDLILLAEVDHFLPDRARYLSKLEKHLATEGQIAISNKRIHREAVLHAAKIAGLEPRSEFIGLPAHFLIIFGAAP